MLGLESLEKSSFFLVMRSSAKNSAEGLLCCISNAAFLATSSCCAAAEKMIYGFYSSWLIVAELFSRLLASTQAKAGYIC